MKSFHQRSALPLAETAIFAVLAPCFSAILFLPGNHETQHAAA